MLFPTGLNLVGGGLAMVPLVLIVALIAGASPGNAAAAPGVVAVDLFVLFLIAIAFSIWAGTHSDAAATPS